MPELTRDQAERIWNTLTDEEKIAVDEEKKKGARPSWALRKVAGQKLAERERTLSETQSEADLLTEEPSAADKARAFGMGAADVMSMGFGDEARGVVNALGKKGNPVDLYKEGRDESRAVKEGPLAGAFGGGQLAGTGVDLVTGLGGAAGGLKTGLTGGVLKQGAKLGAGAGAATGLGRSESDTVMGDLENMLMGGGTGALLGMVPGALANSPVAAAAMKRALSRVGPAAKLGANKALDQALTSQNAGPVTSGLAKFTQAVLGRAPELKPPAPVALPSAAQPPVQGGTLGALGNVLREDMPVDVMVGGGKPAAPREEMPVDVMTGLGKVLEQPMTATEPPLAVSAPSGGRMLNQRFQLERELENMRAMPPAERQAYFEKLTELHGKNQGGDIAKLAQMFGVTPSATAPKMSDQPAFIRSASMEGAHTPKQFATNAPWNNPSDAGAAIGRAGKMQEFTGTEAMWRERFIAPLVEELQGLSPAEQQQGLMVVRERFPAVADEVAQRLGLGEKK